MTHISLTRRALLVATLATPALVRARAAWAEGPLPLVQPTIDEGTLTDGVRHFDLTVALGQTEFLPGHPAATVGINAPYLGPVLKLRKGEEVRVNVTSRLGQKVALHWHGLAVPPAMAGSPDRTFAKDETWSVTFPVADRAGSYWYHAHRHGKTGPHVWAGMAGAIRIEDEEEAALPLPRTQGEDDFLLILQDRRFDTGGGMPYDITEQDRVAGMLGDRMLVNGQLSPELKVATPRIRLRILNAANAATYRLHFADGRTFQQIATDGGLLPAPRSMSESWLPPGARGEFIVDLSDGAETLLRAELFGADAPTAGAARTLDVLPIRPDKARAAPPALPATLSPMPALIKPVEQRLLTLAPKGDGTTGAFLINGATYDAKEVAFIAAAGSTEAWVFENTSAAQHPMHIHGGQFRVVSRNGAPPAPSDEGWHDVVLVRPGERIEIRMTFPDISDMATPLAFHSHVLEHEDLGMMGQFVLI